MDIFLSALRQPARQTKYLGERQATRMTAGRAAAISMSCWTLIEVVYHGGISSDESEAWGVVKHRPHELLGRKLLDNGLCTESPCVFV
jgi:hypothetical protein